jgi:hypothetical protein
VRWCAGGWAGGRGIGGFGRRDLDQVRVDIEAARPGVVSGHGGAEAGRLRAELEELTGKPVALSILDAPGPQEGPGDAGSGHAAG